MKMECYLVQVDTWMYHGLDESFCKKIDSKFFPVKIYFYVSL